MAQNISDFLRSRAQTQHITHLEVRTVENAWQPDGARVTTLDRFKIGQDRDDQRPNDPWIRLVRVLPSANDEPDGFWLNCSELVSFTLIDKANI